MSHCLGPRSPENLRACYKNMRLGALNLKRQPCCQRALTTRDAPGIVRLRFTRSYFKMSKGFCLSYEHDRLLSWRASTVGGLGVSKQHPFTRAHLLPAQPSARCFPQTPKPGGKASLFHLNEPPSYRQPKPDCSVKPETESPQQNLEACEENPCSTGERGASLPARPRCRTNAAGLIPYFLTPHPY